MVSASVGSVVGMIASLEESQPASKKTIYVLIYISKFSLHFSDQKHHVPGMTSL